MLDSLSPPSVGVCAYGLAYHCGFALAGTPQAYPRPLDGRALLRLAAERRLALVELPPSLLPGLDDAAISAFREEAEALGLGVIVASGLVEEEPLRRDIQRAHALGAPAVRCILSRVLCGDRRGFPGGWSGHAQRCRSALAAVLPEAERLGVSIAVENHQDIDSAELLDLCRHFESPQLGVTLDTGNPLAVMEDPVAFATVLAPYLKHVHLKDYRVHPAPNGVRLVRCAAGSGVIDFPGLLQVCATAPQRVTLSLEQAALQARQIPFTEPTWWDEFRPRTARSTAAPLAVFFAGLQPPDSEWRTPFEREEAPELLAAYEWEEFEQSVCYFRELNLTAGG